MIDDAPSLSRETEKKLSVPFAFPSQSDVVPRSRKIPLRRVLGYMGSPQRGAKTRFSSLVASVTWENVLREDTVYLRKTHAVSEIEVFSLALNPSVPAQKADILRVLFAIDRAVQNPVLFRVFPRGDGVFYYAARPKKTGAAGLSPAGDATLQQCYATSATFVPAMVDAFTPLPPAGTLEELYIGLIATIANLLTVPAEKLCGLSARSVKIQKLRANKETLQARKRNAPQANTRYELHKKIDSIAREIESLGGF